MHLPSLPSSIRWLALALAGAATVGLVAASTSQKNEQAETSSAALDEPERGVQDPRVQLGALQVAVDPETGDLRPLTKQEAAQLANEMRKRFKPRDIGEPVQRADGAMSAVVVPNVLRFSVAKVREDGTVALDCTDGTEDAIDHLTHATTSPATQPRDVK